MECTQARRPGQARRTVADLVSGAPAASATPVRFCFLSMWLVDIAALRW